MLFYVYIATSNKLEIKLNEKGCVVVKPHENLNSNNTELSEKLSTDRGKKQISIQNII